MPRNERPNILKVSCCYFPPIFPEIAPSEQAHRTHCADLGKPSFANATVGRLAVIAAPNVVELVNVDFAAERIAVDAEHLGGARLVAIKAFKNPSDEFLLEFRDGFLEQNSALDHHAYERFQLIFHDCTLHRCGSGNGITP
jgi:hypothetical protein